jgi:isocitrate dehydrogenase (NAD+)
VGLRVCLIPGDGIGPEVVAAARRALDATGVEIEWEAHEVGEAAYRQAGEALPEPVVEAIRECGLALKGPVATRPGDPYRSVNVMLREQLDLFLGVRPCRAMPGTPAPFPDTDLTVVRMHSGDLYAGFEFPSDDPTAAAIRDAVAAADGPRLDADAGISLKPISALAAERAARAAFDWAVESGRRRVTIVHKANVMRASDGVFLEAARDAAADFPGLEVDDRLVDRVCADLVRAPASFDVLFAPMLYGDIVSDLAGALCGGLGVAPGANLGDGCAVFEAVHGIAQRHAGKGTANPAALILSGALLLRRGGEGDAAARVEAAVEGAIAAGAVTADLAGVGVEPTSTAGMADAIVERL